MSNKLINFDEQFQLYTAEWIKENAAAYGNNYDRMEEQMPAVYIKWLSKAAPWLDGQTPGTYFAQFSDAPALVKWMSEYIQANIPVPDQLMERIVDLGEASEQALFALLGSGSSDDTRAAAISLLTELDSKLPLSLYIQWIAKAEDAQSERVELAVEALAAMGREVLEPVHAAVGGASPAGQEAFLDVLCNFPGDDKTFSLATALFKRETGKRALLASLLGKLGDARAIPILLDAMDDTDINYLDYIELRNAVEALGGDAPLERAFDGDPYFESLKRIE